MKAKTLQIVWHSKDPVFSVDFHPDGYLATGGGDKDIKLWELSCDGDGMPQVRFAASLQGHSRTINCVRFSRTGHCLASAGDSGEILVWRPSGACTAAAANPPTPHARAKSPGTTPAPAPSPAAAAAGAGAGASLGGPDDGGAASPLAGVWRASGALRGHHNDVTDLAWAHDDAVLMSGSVENEVMLFDVDARKHLARLEGHRHYVQGVAWDPLGAWMVSQGADRSVRVHGLKPPPSSSKAAKAAAAAASGAAVAPAAATSSVALARQVLHTHTLAKTQLAGAPAPPQGQQGGEPDAAAAPHSAKAATAPLFADESLNTFFRRLAWSPCGSLLAVPAGVLRPHAGAAPRHATYLYARGHWGAPLAALPCPSKASTVARFCPVVFHRRPAGAAATAAAAQPGDGPLGAAVQQQQQQQRQQQQLAAAGAGDDDGLGLPFRLVLAVATMDSVLLYDTQTLQPFVLVGPLHFAPITDLAWSRDGRMLAVSSHDGYCSLLTFQPGELGQPLAEEQLPPGLRAALGQAAAAAAATASKGAAGGGAASAPGAAKPATPGAAPAAAPAATPAAAVPAPGAQAAQPQPAPVRRRIQPQPVAAASSGVAATPAPAAAAATPAPAAAAATPAAPAASSAAAVSSGAAAAAPGAAPAAPVVPRPLRRVTPQPVAAAPGAAAAAAAPPAAPSPQQQAAAPSAAAGVRTGTAAVAAALAAAAARKRAAAAAKAGAQEQQAGAGLGGGSGEAKRAKLG